MTRALLLALVSLLGCAHARVDDPPLEMTLTATGLKEEERRLLEQQLCAMPSVRDCKIEHKKGVTTVTFTYRGSLGELRGRIASLPHPGLTPKRAAAQLSYDGFDNLAPSITLLEPRAGQVLSYRRVLFRVEVKDKDAASVTIDDVLATQSEAVWQAAKELDEGHHDVVVIAKDDVGNERQLTVGVDIDTTPPKFEVTLSQQPNDVVLIEGKVLESGAVVEIDGRPVALDLFQGFKLEVRRDPDKQSVEIVVRDAHGNERSERRSLKDGRVLSGG